MKEFLPSYQTYCYDGTLEGELCAFSCAIKNHEIPLDIMPPKRRQESLFSSGKTIETSLEIAYDFASKLENFFGNEEFKRLKMTYLSDNPKRELIAYKYVILALQNGKFTWCDLSDPIVSKYEKLWKQVYNERHRMLQFVRFTKAQNGVFFSKINPKANVVPVIMEHFSKRFNTQAFLIYDEVHKIAGISHKGKWSLVDADEITIPQVSQDELEWQKMWRTFYNKICNDERTNHALRMSFMPKRLWGNIIEVSD